MGLSCWWMRYPGQCVSGGNCVLAVVVAAMTSGGGFFIRSFIFCLTETPRTLFIEMAALKSYSTYNAFHFLRKTQVCETLLAHQWEFCLLNFIGLTIMDKQLFQLTLSV